MTEGFSDAARRCWSMPIFRLIDEHVFPPTGLSEPSGLLAVGGDLDPNRLLIAYSMGIFPWFNEGDPILWHAPLERTVLPVEALRVNRSTRKALRRNAYRVTFDTAFDRVIDACATIHRPDQDGTWITGAMAAAYRELHQLGFAHSVETWRDDELVGGLYGVSLGGAFFGESMFAMANNASKAAFVTLVTTLNAWEFDFIDCQVPTELLASFGAREVSRDHFERMLELALAKPTSKGKWPTPRP